MQKRAAQSAPFCNYLVIDHLFLQKKKIHN